MNKFFDMLRGDRVIWIMVILLTLVSILEVYSSTSMLAYKYKEGNTVFYIFRHISFIVVGFGVMFAASRISYKSYFKIAGPFLWISVALLALTLFMGPSTNDARRWFTIPLVGISFQTSDLAKVALMVYLAKILSQSQESDEDLWEGYKKSLIAIVCVCGLVLPANFSTAFLIGATAMIVLFVGRMKLKWLGAALGIAFAALLLFILLMQASGTHSRVGTWSKRIETYFSPDKNTEANFQADQSKIAVARGGIIGKGPGASVQRNVLPHPYSDFIFAVIVEEGGLIGAIVLITIYLILFYRCIITIKNCERTFPAFLALGLTLNLVLQAVANMLVAVNITPVTGQPLPFVSMGGTSMIFTSFSVGIILNISRYSGKKEDVTEIEEEQNVEEVTDYPFIAG